MKNYQIGNIESRFADIIWENEPLSSSALVKICEEIFDWKKSTTYTVLKRLCEKGIFKNANGIVSSVITKEEFYSAKSENFVNETFDGSLPAFIAAFSKGKNLKSEEIDALKRMIAEYEVE